MSMRTVSVVLLRAMRERYFSTTLLSSFSGFAAPLGSAVQRGRFHSSAKVPYRRRHRRRSLKEVSANEFQLKADGKWSSAARLKGMRDCARGRRGKETRAEAPMPAEDTQ